MINNKATLVKNSLFTFLLTLAVMAIPACSVLSSMVGK